MCEIGEIIRTTEEYYALRLIMMIRITLPSNDVNNKNDYVHLNYCHHHHYKNSNNSKSDNNY